MKVLACAASKYGATSEIAQAVADVLSLRGCEVTVLPPERWDCVPSRRRRHTCCSCR